MFTKDQLNRMIQLQSSDCQPRYFQRMLMHQTEDIELAQYIGSLNLKQLEDLQLALSLLAGLPDYDQIK